MVAVDLGTAPLQGGTMNRGGFVQSIQGLNCRVLSTRLQCLAVLVDNDVARLFTDHVNGGQNEQSGNSRENRCVHDPQVLRASNLEVLIENRICVLVGADFASARREMPPRIILDEGVEILIRFGRKLLGDHTVVFQALIYFSYKLNSIHHTLKVVGVFLTALLEIFEVDLGSVERAVGFQLDVTGTIICVPLQHRPGEAIIMTSCLLGIANFLASEIQRQPKNEKIGRIGFFTWRRTFDDPQHGAVGRIKSSAGFPPQRENFVWIRIRRLVAALKGRGPKQPERLRSPGDDAYFVSGFVAR